MATDTETITLTIPCPICSNGSTVTAKASQFRAWSEGALIQSAFPDMDAAIREILITGICPPCWDQMFAD